MAKMGAGSSNKSATSTAGQIGHTVRSTPWIQVNRKKQSLAKKSPYNAGKGDSMNTGVKPFTVPPRTRPEYLSNKCLVVAGINPELTLDQFKEGINSISQEKANRDIDFKHIELISKTPHGHVTKHLTVAIELNDDDFLLMNDVNFWDPQLRIRKFVGWRWWRGAMQKKPKITPQERKNAVRNSWATT